MKTATKSLGAVFAIAGVAFAAASFWSGPDKPKKSGKKTAQEIAVDTLEQQLQRRFHDRNNITFGYGRMVRWGSRDHGSTVMELLRKGGVSDENGLPLPTRRTGEAYEIEVEPGVWMDASRIREAMHPENDDERKAMTTLKNVQVAIYTAGMFDVESGEPTRLKGPAYLRQTTPEAPDKTKLLPIAKRAWATTSDADELRQAGWTYRVVKVKADDQSCINCHGEQRGSFERVAKKHTFSNLKVGDTLGVFIIGTKPLGK
jgi:hypothetical protein